MDLVCGEWGGGGEGDEAAGEARDEDQDHPIVLLDHCLFPPRPL